MKAMRCAAALCGGKPTDLAAGTASRRSNFLAARLNGTENPPKCLVIRRMSDKSRSTKPGSGKYSVRLLRQRSRIGLVRSMEKGHEDRVYWLRKAWFPLCACYC